ncbi:hypothetical protein MAIT1_03857 [Magnetofaba australis IT-1]|uniref:Uncharacterized protein n=1 Tax=Magnetofaba australis IT-1 TaxID=1434232 RepID=A0A1Y2KBM3_9PROT|nr:hypothetical protein MAIT1_03857 [Magnetofaba australis IT-1]
MHRILAEQPAFRRIWGPLFYSGFIWVGWTLCDFFYNAPAATLPVLLLGAPMLLLGVWGWGMLLLGVLSPQRNALFSSPDERELAAKADAVLARRDAKRNRSA